MIITVTLNAAIDKSLSVPNFRLGRRHRTVEQTTMPGGKGVNVARTLKTLGQPVIATGFAGGPTGTRIVEQLTEESILNDFVRIREESRTNTAVHDPTNGETTEINERGPAVSAKEIELFRDKLLYLARGADVVVFAGSLPRGVEAELYAQLIKEVRKAGVQTVVDADGDPMRLAVRRHEARLHLPDLIELTGDPSDPAAHEAVTSINVALKDPEDAAAFAKEAPSLIPVQGLIARTARGDSTTARLFVVLDRFHQAIALVTIVASTTFLLALMLMLVDERRQTVGILRLIGIRQHRLLLQVLIEGLIVALAGAAFGIALAAVLQSAVNAFFQWRYDTALVFVRITPGIAARCALIAVPLGVSASLVSSWALLRSGVLALAKR